MAARGDKAKRSGTRRGAGRGAGTARPSGLPPDPQDLGRPMTPDEKIDEASLESMVASDPPARPMSTGAPPRRKGPAQPGDETIERRERELWEADGRPAGRDEDYWRRAANEIRPRHP